MIKFGIRQSFDRIEQVEERYTNLRVPVEVALPYYWDIYAENRDEIHHEAVAQLMSRDPLRFHTTCLWRRFIRSKI